MILVVDKTSTSTVHIPNNGKQAEDYVTAGIYQSEIDKLSSISEKSIAGVITTNYDTFLEDHFKGFTKYVGQNQLIFLQTPKVNLLKQNYDRRVGPELELYQQVTDR